MLQTILIVDDSLPLHALIKVQLEPECINIHSVFDGETAIAAAKTLRPDLILLDVDMPHMDGFEVCRQLKEDAETASIPVVFLSADSISADKARGLGLGAIDYIVKPFRPEELISRVRSSLGPVPVSTDQRLVDPVTGLGNRMFFEKKLSECLARCGETNQPLACTVVQIDQLGTISSKFGALVASQVVRKIAAWLCDQVGPETTVCCLPNRRFALLSENNDRFSAANMAKKLQRTLGQKFVPAGTTVSVTCSFGVCDASIASPQTLLERAGQVTDRAANSGGNCVSVARAPAKAAIAA